MVPARDSARHAPTHECRSLLLPLVGTAVRILHHTPPGGAPLAIDDRLLSGVRVLVVDDNVDQLDLLRTVLTVAGANVATAPGAQEALDSFRAHPPDIVISDLAMPQATGYNLVRTIRSQVGSKVPMVAITAFPVEEHWQKALDAGFDEWIPKPAHGVVVNVVARLLRR